MHIFFFFFSFFACKICVDLGIIAKNHGGWWPMFCGHFFFGSLIPPQKRAVFLQMLINEKKSYEKWEIILPLLRIIVGWNPWFVFILNDGWTLWRSHRGMSCSLSLSWLDGPRWWPVDQVNLQWVIFVFRKILKKMIFFFNIWLFYKIYI